MGGTSERLPWLGRPAGGWMVRAVAEAVQQLPAHALLAAQTLHPCMQSPDSTFNLPVCPEVATLEQRFS